MSLSFILAMAWKSAVISGAALLLAALLRERSAADRAALLRVGVLLLLLLPFVSLVLPALTIETAPEAAVALPALTAAQLAALAAAAPDAGRASLWQQTELLAALAYASGLLLIGLRFGAGLLTLRRWTRCGRQVTSPAWTSALARHLPPGKATPRLIASDEVASPISWGLLRPVILLDPASVERTELADAVLAHEMAHVARRDWLALVLARAAVALFWFNPLVWLLEREVAQHCEEAADSHALEQVEAVRYAQTLVTCAQRCSRSRVPANSMAGSGRRLARRVRAVLDGRSRAPSGSRWTAAAIVGCVALTAPVAALQLVDGARPAPPSAPAVPLAPLASRAPAAALAPAAPLAPATATAVQAPAAVQAPVPPAAPGPGQVRRDGFDVEIDEEAIERAAEAAEEAAERAADRAERIAERASIDAERIAEHASARAERIAANADQISAHAMKSARAAHAAGAESMIHGAASMEAGARQMDQAATKLRSKEYREREIARAAAQGRRVTHEELLRAIPEMQKGAREMREGAREMRAGAAEMRRQGI
jgi:beta-lactamase regulating signal transducer with metallopeptidase domain